MKWTCHINKVNLWISYQPHINKAYMVIICFQSSQFSVFFSRRSSVNFQWWQHDEEFNLIIMWIGLIFQNKRLTPPRNCDTRKYNFLHQYCELYREKVFSYIKSNFHLQTKCTLQDKIASCNVKLIYWTPDVYE
jgi:hypothetical protein